MIWWLLIWIIFVDNDQGQDRILSCFWGPAQGLSDAKKKKKKRKKEKGKEKEKEEERKKKMKRLIDHVGLLLITDIACY